MSQRKRSESQSPQKDDVRLTELSICIRLALIQQQEKWRALNDHNGK